MNRDQAPTNHSLLLYTDSDLIAHWLDQHGPWDVPSQAPQRVVILGLLAAVPPLDLLRGWRARWPQSGGLYLCPQPNPLNLYLAWGYGFRGILAWSGLHLERLLACFQHLQRGRFCFCPQVQQVWRASQPQRRLLADLAPPLLDVLQGMAAGYSQAAIAAQLGCHVNNIHQCQRRLRQHCGAEDNRQLLRYFVGEA